VYRFITKLFFILFIFASVKLFSNCVTGSDGSWSNPSTWNPAVKPQCGDTVLIPNGAEVDITTIENYAGCGSGITIIINGELHFQTGKKLTLSCDSKVIVNNGGEVTADNGGGNSNYIEICAQIVWNSTSGNLYGPLQLTSGGPLPVELTYFSAEIINRKVVTQWSTATELNCDYFTVERSSDGFEYTDLIKVQGAGTTGDKHDYSITDQQAVEGNSYYRLRQTDFDGKQKTYSAVQVYLENKSFNIYPNPSKGTIYISTDGENENFKIYNSSGVIIRNLELNNGVTLFDLDLDPGIYFLFDTEHNKKTKITIE
jgi:hypothetical protein